MLHSFFDRRAQQDLGAWRRSYFRNSTALPRRHELRTLTKMARGRFSGLRLEALEPRYLLSADLMPFMVNMGGPDGNNLTLRYDADNGVVQSL